MENELIFFIKTFFENLGASVELKDEILSVLNVPFNFEKFYGKKAPYKFTLEKTRQSSETDFIKKGSYILETISSYLENSGKKTLLKLNFEIDPLVEIKKKISLGNFHIGKLEQKKRFGFLFRFTFSTIFQYLNEKEKIINEIFIFENKVIKGNLSDYSVQEGEKREIQIPEIKEQYFIAKEELKKRIKDKTFEVASELNLKLNLEKKRIENHFSNESKEIGENLEKAKNKLLDLAEEGNLEKIFKQKKTIDTLRIKKDFQEVEKDKERAIQLEKQKHMLNIKNKLLNTTLIYYPLFIYNASLKNAEIKRIIEIGFDPIKEKLNSLFCESCLKEMKEIFLCSTGHISCKECVIKCESCNKDFCKKCLKKVCEICSKKICKDCSVRCFRCSRMVCKIHTKEDKVSGKIHCNDCLRRCERCSSLKDPSSFKISKKTNVKICGDCFRREMKEGVLREVFD